MIYNLGPNIKFSISSFFMRPRRKEVGGFIKMTKISFFIFRKSQNVSNQYTHAFRHDNLFRYGEPALGPTSAAAFIDIWLFFPHLSYFQLLVYSITKLKKKRILQYKLGVIGDQGGTFLA